MTKLKTLNDFNWMTYDNSGKLIKLKELKQEGIKQHKAIEFGLKLRREELREEIKKLEKLRTSDFARRDFKMEKLTEEFEDIQKQLKNLREVRNSSHA